MVFTSLGPPGRELYEWAGTAANQVPHIIHPQYSCTDPPLVRTTTGMEHQAVSLLRIFQLEFPAVLVTNLANENGLSGRRHTNQFFVVAKLSCAKLRNGVLKGSHTIRKPSLMSIFRFTYNMGLRMGIIYIRKYLLYQIPHTAVAPQK